MAGPSRIPLQWPMNNRDGTTNKDVKLQNVMAERGNEVSYLLKRPGTSVAIAAGAGVGQGLGVLNDIIVGVSGDTFQIISAPPNSGTSMTTLLGYQVPWTGRSDAALVTFNSRMWVLGGAATGVAGGAGDVWSSPDGVNWTPNAGSAPWGGRIGQRVVVVNGVMYVMGGQQIVAPGGALGVFYNDVWSTVDGTEWKQVTASAAWDPRRDFALAASSSGIFLIGGQGQFIPAHDDVWFSADGKSWSRLGGPFPWVSRRGHSALWFKNKIYIIGGFDAGGNPLNDVWSSPNGLAWTQETAAAFASGGRGFGGAVVYADRMWYIMGQLAAGATSERWKSPTNGTGAWSLAGTGGLLGTAGVSATVFGAAPASGANRFPTIWFTQGVIPPSTYLNPPFIIYGSMDVTLTANTAMFPPVPFLPYTFNSFNTGTRLLVKSEKALYIYDAGTINRVIDSGYPETTMPGLVVLGGFAYVLDRSGLIHNCALDNPYYWPALNVLGADYEEDRGVAILKYLNYVVVLGENTIQLFYDSGLQYGSPLKPYLNANARVGCCNKYTAMRVGNNIAWMSQTVERHWQVMTMDGVSPKVISNMYVEKMLETGAFTTPNARAFVVEIRGHLFYGIARGADTTDGVALVFDFTTGDWFEWKKASGAPVYYSGHTPFSATGESGQLNYVQDFLTGTVRQIGAGHQMDDGAIPFQVYIRTGKVDNKNNRSKFWGRMDIIGDQNPGTPSIYFTDDDYQTYSPARQVNMASLRPALFRNGASRRRAWVYEQTDANPMRVEAIEHDFEQGT